MRAKNKKKKLPIHHRIHRHLKKHLTRLKKKHPHVHKSLVLASITLPLVLGAVLFGSSALYMYESYFDNTDYSKEKITVNLPAAPDDTVNWKIYRDDLSGFSIKYPDRWDNPTVNKGGNYLEKISFSNGLDSSDEDYKGFQVYLYDAGKYPGPAGTDNLTPKNSVTFKASSCAQAEFGEASIGDEDYAGQEVFVTGESECFKETYFFSVTRSGYTLNLVPEVGQVDSPLGNDIKSEVIMGFPKFFELISTLIIPEKKIVKEDVPEEKTITDPVVKKAPPHRTLVKLGTCRHKNDHPRKSKTKKHRHMDEDCCMDPDEWPNPRCQY